MHLIEFGSAIKKLCQYYERKEPTQGAIELWFDSIKKIPSEPIEFIIKKINETHDSFPKNIPQAFWNSYYEWKTANPEKLEQDRLFDCPDCNHGLIFVKKMNESGVVYRYVFNCSLCRQSKRDYPFISKKELISDGYNVL